MIHLTFDSRANAAATHWQHNWTVATLATWEEWNESIRCSAGDSLATAEPGWAVLVGRPRLVNLARTQDAFGKGGYLRQAIDQLPDEPRLLLALVESHEAIDTRCSTEFCFDEMTTTALNNLRERAKTAPPDLHGWGYQLLRDSHATAIANLAAFDQLLRVAGEFATLADTYPSLRAEANVHIAYLAIRAARPDAALVPVAIGKTSDEPFVRYLAELFAGRALESLGRRTDAIAAYRHGLAMFPGAPSAATRLAAQLFLSDDANERNQANAILETIATISSRSVDPWDGYWQGDARLRPVYMDRLRQDLRQ
jgi:hypothetical protein